MWAERGRRCRGFCVMSFLVFIVGSEIKCRNMVRLGFEMGI